MSTCKECGTPLDLEGSPNSCFGFCIFCWAFQSMIGQAKAASAQLLNSLSLEELFDSFGITRVGRVDTLDTIGIPVWSACRPYSKSVSVSAGKSLDNDLARAGAIAEAIETHTFENPVGEWDYHLVTRSDFSRLPVSKFYHGEADLVPVERVRHYLTGRQQLLPSEIIWLRNRPGIKYSKLFQRSSNGQALGPTWESAFVAGLYECIERDAITIRLATLREFNIFPPALEPPESELTDRIAAAGLKPLLFYCTVDIPVPVVWCFLADPTGEQTGYSGYGTDIDLERATQKAMLEAVQSRAIYIAGARDDMNWLKLCELREKGHKSVIASYAQLERVSPTLPADFGAELQRILGRLGDWQENLFFKHLLLPYSLHAVKTIILGLEPLITEQWKGGPRWNQIRQSILADQVCGVAI